ncbi:hypothetical protein GCM10010182_00670 [Actinomadura cremea]|nr:hypothetical protein GCM10010182_00670 [Actinomadura cremea]
MTCEADPCRRAGAHRFRWAPRIRTLTASHLRLKRSGGGSVRVAKAGARTTDYKSGVEEPNHAEQIRLYALL